MSTKSSFLIFSLTTSPSNIWLPKASFFIQLVKFVHKLKFYFVSTQHETSLLKSLDLAALLKLPNEIKAHKPKKEISALSFIEINYSSKVNSWLIIEINDYIGNTLTMFILQRGLKEILIIINICISIIYLIKFFSRVCFCLSMFIQDWLKKIIFSFKSFLEMRFLHWLWC